MTLNTQKVEFVRSAASPKDFLRDGLPQICFAGRSNVGKSSVINRLLNRKNFARVGSAPGKTVHINYFFVDETLYLVDLPGYGYAKVPQAEKDRWAYLIQSWFEEPSLMTLGVLLVDIRHKPTANDITMANFYKATGKPWVVVANKLDKVKKCALAANLTLIRETLALPDQGKIIPFSAEKGMGRDELLDVIASHGEKVFP